MYNWVIPPLAAPVSPCDRDFRRNWYYGNPLVYLMKLLLWTSRIHVLNCVFHTRLWRGTRSKRNCRLDVLVLIDDVLVLPIWRGSSQYDVWEHWLHLSADMLFFLIRTKFGPPRVHAMFLSWLSQSLLFFLLTWTFLFIVIAEFAIQVIFIGVCMLSDLCSYYINS